MSKIRIYARKVPRLCATKPRNGSRSEHKKAAIELLRFISPGSGFWLSGHEDLERGACESSELVVRGRLAVEELELRCASFFLALT